MTSTVRLATAGDAEGIAALHIASWRAVYRQELPAAFLGGLDSAARTTEWRRRLVDPALTVLVDTAEGSIRGFCAVGPAADPSEAVAGAWQIHQLHIAPDLRGGGIGSRLFDAALDLARAAGAPLVTLWVVDTNAQARRFYERRGMRADGARQRRDLAPGAVLHEVRYRLPLPRVRPSRALP